MGKEFGPISWYSEAMLGISLSHSAVSYVVPRFESGLAVYKVSTLPLVLFILDNCFEYAEVSNIHVIKLAILYFISTLFF